MEGLFGVADDFAAAACMPGPALPRSFAALSRCAGLAVLCFGAGGAWGGWYTNKAWHAPSILGHLDNESENVRASHAEQGFLLIAKCWSGVVPQPEYVADTFGVFGTDFR